MGMFDILPILSLVFGLIMLALCVLLWYYALSASMGLVGEFCFIVLVMIFIIILLFNYWFTVSSVANLVNDVAHVSQSQASSAAGGDSGRAEGPGKQDDSWHANICRELQVCHFVIPGPTRLLTRTTYPLGDNTHSTPAQRYSATVTDPLEMDEAEFVRRCVKTILGQGQEYVVCVGGVE